MCYIYFSINAHTYHESVCVCVDWLRLCVILCVCWRKPSWRKYWSVSKLFSACVFCSVYMVYHLVLTNCNRQNRVASFAKFCVCVDYECAGFNAVCFGFLSGNIKHACVCCYWCIFTPLNINNVTVWKFCSVLVWIHFNSWDI